MSSKVSIAERLASIRNCFTSGIAFKTSIRATASRWLDRVLLGVAAALSFYLLFPLVLATIPFSGSISIWILLPTAALAGWAIQAIQRTYSIRFRRKELQPDNSINISATLKYPTLHFSLFIAAGILLSIALQAGELYLNQTSSLLLITLLFSYTITVILNSPATSHENSGPSRTLNLDSCSDDEFKEWITDESPSAEFDFYYRQPYITRMATRVLEKTESSGQRGQVLYGEFGTGKTTLIKLVEQEILRQEPDRWIVSNFDCWGRSEDPQVLIKLFLEQVVSDIGESVEAASLHSVPSDYLEAAYGVSPWIKLVAPFLPTHDSHSVLNRINKLLESQDLKLLLVIENIDRSQSAESLVNSVASVLDQVSQFSSIRFIFSGSKEALPLPAISRVADYTEVLANNLSPLVIGQFLKICLDYSLNSEREKRPVIPWLKKDFITASASNVLRHFELEREVSELYESLRSKGTNEQLLDALVNCLATPRQLKLVLRYVYERWQNLEGEVNLIDLLLYGTYINDGEIMDVLEAYKNNMPKSGSPDDPFFIGKKEEGTIERNRGERRKAENEESKYPGSHSQQTIAFYLANGHHDMYETRSIQRIRDTKLAHKIKYTMIANSGDVIGYPSDQRFISYLNEIAKGDQTAFARLMGDSSLDLKADYISEILEELKEKHWKSVLPLLPLTKALITFKGDTESKAYRDFRFHVLNALLDPSNWSEIPPEELNQPNGDQKQRTNAIKEVLSHALESLFTEGRYTQISKSIRALMLNRNYVHFDDVFKPLLERFYSTKSLQEWVKTDQHIGQERHALWWYFLIIKEFDQYNYPEGPSPELWVLVCKALLKVLYFRTNCTADSIKLFFKGYDGKTEIQTSLLEKATSSQVYPELLPKALKALEGLKEAYGEEALE